MEYIVAAESDIGIAKSVNQDSLCVKVAETELGNAALLLICDGMGGLAMGELASAEVVQSFSEWFENDFPKHLRSFDREDIARQVAELLSSLNEKLIAYGEANRLTMGTNDYFQPAVPLFPRRRYKDIQSLSSVKLSYRGSHLCQSGSEIRANDSPTS